MSCNCQTPQCGCTETALTSPVTTACNNAEPCEEITNFECVKYTGNDIYYSSINSGDRLDIVIKKILTYINGYNPNGSCQPIYDFEIINIKSTEATVVWSYPPAPAATTAVQLVYWISGQPQVTVDLSSSYTQWTINNLLPNTTYLLAINSSTVDEENCTNSITLKFKTLAV